MEIITIFNRDKADCLSQQTMEIPLTLEGLKEAETIAHHLIETLTPLMPAAGLAAPQIGISKKVFIYSWDRSLKHIEVVINPTITDFSPDFDTSWEACFSTLQEDGVSQAALVTRAKSVNVEYTNLKGQIVKRKLEGFAAKVFQHEYDHLHGIENVRKKGAEVKNFSTKTELIKFMKNVKNKDSINYMPPLAET